MCVYICFLFQYLQNKNKKHLTNTISSFKRMQIITRKTAQEPRKIERGRIKERFPANMLWDAGSGDTACSDRPTETPKSNERVVERERESEKDELEEDPDSQTVSSDTVSFASLWGLLGVVLFGFPRTLCPYEHRLSSPRRIRFREGRGTPGWTPSRCLWLGACSLAPWDDVEKISTLHQHILK